MPTHRIICGDCLEELKKLPGGHFHCVVTSPPYFALRRYTDGDPRELGSEASPDEYIAKQVEVFRGAPGAAGRCKFVA